MVQQFEIIIEQDEEGYYVVSVPALTGCHTQARSPDVLMERVKAAIELCLEAGDPTQPPPPLRLVGVQRLTVDI
jgi:predicted RNase H-like HicB family nuclease